MATDAHACANADRNLLKPSTARVSHAEVGCEETLMHKNAFGSRTAQRSHVGMDGNWPNVGIQVGPVSQVSSSIITRKDRATESKFSLAAGDQTPNRPHILLGF